MSTLRLLLFMLCLTAYESASAASRLLRLRTVTTGRIAQRTTVSVARFPANSNKSPQQRPVSWNTLKFMSLIFGMSISY